jgi:hypothetical protein
MVVGMFLGAEFGCSGDVVEEDRRWRGGSVVDVVEEKALQENPSYNNAFICI